ncbi:MAG: amidohydrolase family protein [Candidatus Gastranaerophilales bacterium]|nr:amidohydrolase family protein [Candidatus Gastranaerophilales bacterium]
MYKTEGFIEQHFHGAFGIDFMDCTADEVVDVAVEMAKFGTTIIYPTLMTGEISQIKKQIAVMKEAQAKQPAQSAKIAGVHLEGPFINSLKKGIHQQEYILKPTIQDYKKIEDEIIKIVTLAPELDENRNLCKYLKDKGVKIQAGHTMADDLTYCNSVTHLFNAMAPLSHKFKNIISGSLVNDDIYVELIADGNHVVDEVLEMVFKLKAMDKIILISDALPIAHEGGKKGVFAGQDVYLNNGSFYNTNGTLAGSGMFQCDILKRLVTSGLLSFEQAAYMMNISPAKYLNLLHNAYVLFDDDLNPVQVNFI